MESFDEDDDLKLYPFIRDIHPLLILIQSSAIHFQSSGFNDSCKSVACRACLESHLMMGM
jgi:hypothetical protein